MVYVIISILTHVFLLCTTLIKIHTVKYRFMINVFETCRNMHEV